MRTVPAAHTAARQSSSSRLAKIWRIERLDGTVLRFTEHDRDLIVGGETFLATASFDPSAIKHTSGLEVGDLDVHGAFDSEHITAEDLLAGRYWGATFWVGECLWDDVAEGKDILKFGWLGRVKEIGGRFVAELLDPSSRLQHQIVKQYQAQCRATLGDAQCGVNLAAFTMTTAVTGVTNRRVFVAELIGAYADSWARYGLATFTSGANAGIAMEVYDSDDGSMTLLLPMPFDIEVGDELTISSGCDHSLTMCRDRYANVLNFRGEPHAPVTDDLIKGPVRDGISTAGGGDGSGPGGSVSPPATPAPETPTISGSPTISAS